MISSQLPQLFMKAMTSIVSSKFVVLLMINVIFLILGCLMEGNCIIVMMVPLMLSLVNSFGIDLIQFGVIMVLNLMIGVVTPPVGMSLFVVSDLSGVSVEKMAKSVFLLLIPLIIVLLLVTYVPVFSLAIPKLLLG